MPLLGLVKINLMKVFDEAQNLATARNVTVDGVEESIILQSGGGKVRLLAVRIGSRVIRKRTTVSRCGRLRTTYPRTAGRSGRRRKGAATLLRKVGGLAEDAKGLAYRLYTICEQNNGQS